MKKKLFFAVLLTCICGQLFAQGERYKKAKQELIDMGYTIATEMKVTCKEGTTGYSYRTFYSNLDYVVFGISDDGDVKDIDLYIYKSDGTLFEKDADNQDLAVLTFTSDEEIADAKIVIKNYKSNDPDYESVCRYVVAYK